MSSTSRSYLGCTDGIDEYVSTTLVEEKIGFLKQFVLIFRRITGYVYDLGNVLS